MKRKHFIAAALVAAAIAGAQPAAATQQLQADVLEVIAEHSSRTGGCRMLFSADMRVIPRNYVPRQPTRPATRMGGHSEYGR